jgi:hypothetical protein
MAVSSTSKVSELDLSYRDSFQAGELCIEDGPELAERF